MNLGRATLNVKVLFQLRRLLKNFPFRADAIRRMQYVKLRALLDHAYKLPFYRKRLDDAGMPPEKFRSVDDLERIPVLTKADLREWIQSERDRTPHLFRSWYADVTSGSSGTPLTIYRSWGEQAYIIAKWLRSLVLNGYNPLFHKTFCLISPHRLVQKDTILQKLGLFQRHALSYLAEPREMVDKYTRIQPDLFYANKSQFVQMSEYAQEQGMSIIHPKLYAVVAETMDEASRRQIYSVFGEEAFFETYGCIELGTLSLQLKENKDIFHFCHDTNVLELAQDGGEAADAGKAIVTDLHQYVFPLIRYNLGDYLEVDELDGLRVLRRVRGRSDDWITFEDGKKFPFHSFSEMMEDRPEVKRFRVIQESFDLIRIQVVPEKSADNKILETTLQNELRRKVRDVGMTYLIDCVDDIPPDPNGKLRALISKVR
jgi:phenylacetate-CoA ligase